MFGGGVLLLHSILQLLFTTKIKITKQQLLLGTLEVILFSLFLTFINFVRVSIFLVPLFLAVIPTYNFTIAPLKFLFFHKETEKATYIEEKLAKKGFKYKVRIINLKNPNAFATGLLPFYKMIFIDRKILETLPEEQAFSIIYHEVGHHELHHLKKMLLVNILVAVIGFYTLRLNVSNPYYMLSWILIFACVFAFSTLGVQYKLEYQADRFAAKHTSKENMIAALQNLDPLFNYRISKGGITHPKLAKRIANINNEK